MSPIVIVAGVQAQRKELSYREDSVRGHSWDPEPGGIQTLSHSLCAQGGMGSARRGPSLSPPCACLPTQSQGPAPAPPCTGMPCLHTSARGMLAMVMDAFPFRDLDWPGMVTWVRGWATK